MSLPTLLWSVWLGVAAAQEAPASPPPPAMTAAEANAALDRAYQKELAYLYAEKQALESRLRDLESRSARSIAEAERSLDALQARVVATGMEADRAELLLADAERAAWSSEEAAELLRNTLTQAHTALGHADATLPPNDLDEVARAEALARQLKGALSEVAEVISQSGGIRTREGEFFLPDGSQVQGTIVEVGRVASYGVSDRGAGALVPAGEQRLRLWPQDDAAAEARAFAAGQPPATAGIFLYEDVRTRFEAREKESVVEFLDRGGLVAWIIVGLGVLGGLLGLVRLATILAMGPRASVLVASMERSLASGDIAAARQALASQRGAGVRVLSATLDALGLGREALEDIAGEAVLRELPPIQRFATAVIVVAAVAPLLGLLGTVTGMMATFQVITDVGTGDPKLLSGGISEALITTELGLVVAIPMLLLGNMLNSIASGRTEDLEQGPLALVNAIERGRSGPKPPPAGVPEDTVTVVREAGSAHV